MVAMGGQGLCAAHEENISRTTAAFKSCSYIVDGGEGPPQFCDAPAARGSPYCARHRALCLVAPDSPEGIAILREIEREAAQAPPPNVGPMLEREMLEPTAPDEVAQSLVLPRAGDP